MQGTWPRAPLRSRRSAAFATPPLPDESRIERHDATLRNVVILDGDYRCNHVHGGLQPGSGSRVKAAGGTVADICPLDPPVSI